MRSKEKYETRQIITSLVVSPVMDEEYRFHFREYPPHRKLLEPYQALFHWDYDTNLPA
jgi:hypothetical protein